MKQLCIAAHVAFKGYNNKGSHWHSSWPFNSYGGYGGGLGGGIFNPFKWFEHNHHGHPTNHVINFVVTNTVDAPATASATNNNEDNDDISNTGTNAGGKRKRKRRNASHFPHISNHVHEYLGSVEYNNFFSSN